MVSQISSGGFDITSLWQTLFKKLETNSDNTFDTSNFASLAANRGTSAADALVTLGSNQDGIVGTSDFESALSKIRTQHPPSPPPQAMGPSPEKMFEAIDQDGDGAISSDELSSFMTQNNSDVSTSDASKFFAEVDSKGDGSISQSELVSYMQKMGPPPPPDSAGSSTRTDSTTTSTSTDSQVDSTSSDLDWEKKMMEALLNAFNQASNQSGTANSTTDAPLQSTSSDLNWERKMMEALLSAYNQTSSQATESKSTYA
jgi:Ca2+-binding EF-hand superfamily protein